MTRYVTRAWDTPGLPPRTLEERCANHFGPGCEYRDDDPARCPWCHTRWTVILSSGWHSCEHASTWSGEVAQTRVRLARKARERAQDVARGTQ